jgi:hypothetical protein
MRTLQVLLCILLLASCKEEKERAGHLEADTTSRRAGTGTGVQQRISWIEQFRIFRQAVYSGDKNGVRSFIDFPILDEHNEIWFLVREGQDELPGKQDRPVRPFKAADLDTNFDKLFPKPFIDCIQKIKTETLYRTGAFETAQMQYGPGERIKMYATFNSQDSTLELNLLTLTAISETSEPEWDESSVLYYFRVSEAGKLTFFRVGLAG